MKTEHTFTIPAHEARLISTALTCCMSKEETRYYLKGVCLQNDKNLGLTAIATDGHRIGTLKVKLPELLSHDFKVIIPTEAVAWLGKIHKNEGALVDFAIDDTSVTFKCAGQSATFKLIDGNFPDWQRCLPNEPKPVVAFSALYLSEIAAAARKSGTTNAIKLSLVESAQATSPALIETGNDALQYVLMPIRT